MNIDFNKSNGLVPVVIQNYLTLQVLMVGYMNEEAFQKTSKEGKVTFFSRSKNRLWTKGETSGNFLIVKEILADCDNDTILIKAEPVGQPAIQEQSLVLKLKLPKGFYTNCNIQLINV
jgi:phosphoribosyl-ATP pyrophosphohydrolase/phosphoribosyl-AMP cyclohydrolase